MNKIIFACAVLCAALCANAKTADVLTKDEKNALKKRYATRREIITIDDQKYWVVDYAVGGKHVETKTNKVVSVFGVKQENPLEADAKVARKAQKAAEKAEKKDSKNFQKWIKDTEKARDKSSADMAEFYDEILNIATRRANGVK